MEPISSFAIEDVVAGCNQILHPIRQHPNRYLTEIDSSMFKVVTSPLECANGTLLEDLGVCKPTT